MGGHPSARPGAAMRPARTELAWMTSTPRRRASGRTVMALRAMSSTARVVRTGCSAKRAGRAGQLLRSHAERAHALVQGAGRTCDDRRDVLGKALDQRQQRVFCSAHGPGVIDVEDLHGRAARSPATSASTEAAMRAQESVRARSRPAAPSAAARSGLSRSSTERPRSRRGRSRPRAAPFPRRRPLRRPLRDRRRRTADRGPPPRGRRARSPRPRRQPAAGWASRTRRSARTTRRAPRSRRARERARCPRATTPGRSARSSPRSGPSPMTTHRTPGMRARTSGSARSITSKPL